MANMFLLTYLFTLWIGVPRLLLMMKTLLEVRSARIIAHQSTLRSSVIVRDCQCQWNVIERDCVGP